MASKFHFLLFIQIFSLFNSIQAGHPLWEYSTRQENTSIAKRWHSVNPKILEIWQNDKKENVIYYCYANDNAESKLEDLLQAAHRLWLSAGLPQEFQIKKVDRSQRKRADKILLIDYNDEGLYDATLAVAPENVRRKMKNDSPSANFSDKSKDSALKSIAHELGHVWGLAHEHQNKYFWAPPIGEGTDIFQFFCESLPDYSRVSPGQKIWGEDGICNNRAAALKARFSAAEYLPFTKMMIYPQVYDSVTPDMVDWNSIMIYSSSSNQAGQPVFKKSGGGTFAQGVVPSPRDVQGIKQLYNYIPTPLSQSLLSDPDHPLHAQFQSFECDG